MRTVTLAVSRDAQDVLRENVRLFDLFPAQQDTLHLLLGGYSNSEIAEIRQVSEQTVKNVLTIIFAKLGVHSRADCFALLLGLTAEDVTF